MNPSSPPHDDIPALSVIIPSFNSAPFLKQAIESISAQSVKVEVVVQDGGSTDGTLELLKGYDGRVSYCSAPDSGQSQALNRALARSKGDLVGWLNADDFYTGGALDAVVEAAQKHPWADVIYGDYMVTRADGQQVRRYYVQPLTWNRLFSHGCYVWSGATFFRRTTLLEIGGFDESLHYCMDLDLMLRLSKSAKSHYVPMVLGGFRIHSESKSGGVPWNFVIEAHEVRNRHSSGSLGSRATIWKADFTTILYLATRRLWMSSLWSTVRKSKKR